jgi:hypothetical protein
MEIFCKEIDAIQKYDELLKSKSDYTSLGTSISVESELFRDLVSKSCIVYDYTKANEILSEIKANINDHDKTKALSNEFFKIVISKLEHITDIERINYYENILLYNNEGTALYSEAEISKDEVITFTKYYNMTLKDKITIYKLNPLFEIPEIFKTTGDHRYLFHGTKSNCVLKILQSNLKLPNHSGMFGPGIYFANTAIKSKNYSDKYMFIAEVALDHPQTVFAYGGTTVREYSGDIKIPVKLDQNVAPTQGLRLDEFVVFDPRLIVLRYIIKFEKKTTLLY